MGGLYDNNSNLRHLQQPNVSEKTIVSFDDWVVDTYSPAFVVYYIHNEKSAKRQRVIKTGH